MDREIVYAVVFAVAGMAVAGSFMLVPDGSRSAARPHYAPGDFRDNLQPVEAKKKKLKPSTPSPAPQALAPGKATSSAAGDTNDETQEAPSLSEEADAEEPPLE